VQVQAILGHMNYHNAADFKLRFTNKAEISLLSGLLYNEARIQGTMHFPRSCRQWIG
jgi:hypothetical protein